MIDYPSLLALATVVREGSFDKAARTLHVTPSAVSQRIRALEERLGCSLVVRGQPCEATETGRRLCQHLDRVRLLEHELQAQMPTQTSVLEASVPTRVSLPVAVNADSLATWFMPAMADFAPDAAVLLQIAVDDEHHTAQWLRSGQVLAAVTATAAPAAGCNSQPLGALRYVAAASPAFMARYFPEGVDAASLATAPSLMFNAKDELQQRWVMRHGGPLPSPAQRGGLQLPRHILPSSQAFVAAALGGIGWGLHPEMLVREHLARGDLVALKPDSALEVPLYWQQARMASSLLADLTQSVFKAARAGLVA